MNAPTFNTIKNLSYELADREVPGRPSGESAGPRKWTVAVAFPASDDASDITGATLVVDDGWVASHWKPRLGPRKRVLQRSDFSSYHQSWKLISNNYSEISLP